MFPDSYQVIVNGNHPIIAEKLMHATAEQQVDISKHLYRLALLNQNMLSGADLTDFVKKSLQMI